MPKGLDFQIETFKLETGLTYVEAIIEYCKIHKLDLEEIAQNLSKPLLGKIKNEFIINKMVKDIRITNAVKDEFF